MARSRAQTVSTNRHLRGIESWLHQTNQQTLERDSRYYWKVTDSCQDLEVLSIKEPKKPITDHTGILYVHTCLCCSVVVKEVQS